METAVAAITTKIRYLGLEFAAHKTETLHGLPRTRKPLLTWLCVQGERINVKEHLKFPGQTLDSLLNFEGDQTRKSASFTLESSNL